tara:strand:- start:819 stop:1181 length:363 start_codon:yes stop_codon:yes gene_type:complete
VDEKKKIYLLFREGLNHYREGNYFDAHESWEELWSDYYLSDRRFIQGLIQLSVSFVHLERDNLKGARSLLNKSIEKFEEYKGSQRGIDMTNLLNEIYQVRDSYDKLISVTNFDWDIVPKI